jgi:hypothetical protein
MLKDMFATPFFDQRFAAGFENLPSAIRVKAIDLTDFNFDQLAIVMSSHDSLGLQDSPPLLGYQFFMDAHERTLANIVETAANPLVGKRLGKALLIATRGREAARMLVSEARKLAIGTERFTPNIPFIAPPAREAEASTAEDLPPFLSALALAARLDARSAGHVRQFRSALDDALKRGDVTDISLDDGIGVCTRVGFPLFAAHLLLWEVLLRSREE